MSIFKAYTRLVKLYGLESELASSIYDIIYSVRDVTRAYCLGHKPLSVPRLPPPDDVNSPGKAHSYARMLKKYLRILRMCADLYSSILSTGPGSSDAFYLYHLADIASMRFSALEALGFKPDNEILDVIVMDLKEVEVSIYSMITGVKRVTGPLIGAYQHSIVYKAIVDLLELEGYNIRAIAESMANTETPKLREELLEWIKTRGSILSSILSTTTRRKARWIMKPRGSPEAASRKLIRRLERVLGPRAMERLPDIIVYKRFYERGSIMRSYTICSVAKEAADYSDLYIYLLASPRPANYIRTLWRPPRCPYPGFKWPLEEIFKDYVAKAVEWEKVGEAIEAYVKSSAGGNINIPVDVIEKYKIIVKTIASSLSQKRV